MGEKQSGDYRIGEEEEMTSFDYCRVCGVQRYVEGWVDHLLYLEAGWVREQYRREDASGIFYERTEWLCPDCYEKERINEADRQAIMDIGSVGQVSRKGVTVGERSS